MDLGTSSTVDGASRSRPVGPYGGVRRGRSSRALRSASLRAAGESDLCVGVHGGHDGVLVGRPGGRPSLRSGLGACPLPCFMGSALESRVASLRQEVLGEVFVR